MSRKARRIEKQERQEEIAQERRLTDGNNNWKRLGARDPQHAKHTPNHSPYDNNGNGSRPPRALEVFYDLLGWGQTIIRYEKLGDVPPGEKAIVVNGHILVYSSVSGPVSKIPRRMNVDPRHFWPGKYMVGGRSLLEEIGDRWILDSDRSKAYKKLREMTEPAPRAKITESPGNLETRVKLSPGSFVLYHDYPSNDLGHGDRHVLVLDILEAPNKLLGVESTRTFDFLGYKAAHFKIDPSHTPEGLAKTLGIPPEKIRVGHYSDYGGNYFEEAGGAEGIWAMRQIARTAKIPGMPYRF